MSEWQNVVILVDLEERRALSLILHFVAVVWHQSCPIHNFLFWKVAQFMSSVSDWCFWSFYEKFYLEAKKVLQIVFFYNLNTPHRESPNFPQYLKRRWKKLSLDLAKFSQFLFWKLFLGGADIFQSWPYLKDLIDKYVLIFFTQLHKMLKGQKS